MNLDGQEKTATECASSSTRSLEGAAQKPCYGTATKLSPTIRRTIQLGGDVQGSGIRPDTARLARALGLSGFVRNSRRGVEIEVQGSDSAVKTFCERIRGISPGKLEFSAAVPAISQLDGFSILPSDSGSSVSFDLPLDRVTCSECLNEIFDANDRRFGYALNSCAKCGPRFSILTGTPYDRRRTTMAAFEMCSECQTEYDDPENRRFHAQNNCCPKCGPRLWFDSAKVRCTDHAGSIEVAADAVRAGDILAMKGIGGYQLVCDATRDDCVCTLRDRKGRMSKPLAVMVQSTDHARQLATLDRVEQAALQGPAGPIVIAKANEKSPLSRYIHPGLKQVGLMLPTTGMHAMLLEKLGIPLVVTSGNHEGDPLEYEAEHARSRLMDIADCFLHHDRPIANPIDDSVVRCMAGRPATLRAARGLAPMRLSDINTSAKNVGGEPRNAEADLEDSSRHALATGAQQKNAIALSNARVAILGPHIGDLKSPGSRQRFQLCNESLQQLMGCVPAVHCCDQHPNYFGRTWADDRNTEVFEVQHHHAHIVAGMLEHGWLNKEVLGFAFDGTGYGSDGNLWGGEVLLATATRYRRVAHFRQVTLPGGETAIREPWRIAIALLIDTFGLDAERIARELKLPCQDFDMLAKLCSSKLMPQSSSVGRLFDGVASMIEPELACCEFEGQFAMRLESTCSSRSLLAETPAYAFDLDLNSSSEPLEIDWRPVIRAVVNDRLKNDSRSKIALRFHQSLSQCIADCASQFPTHPVVISGGVFQNRVLVEMLAHVLESHTAPVGYPGMIPVNDGGIAAGQLASIACTAADPTYDNSAP